MLKRLPPFAPDYSGVNAVFHELGGLVIINGADGCIGNVTGYDEPRFFEHNAMIVSSGLREINAITGDEEVLMQKIKDLGISRDIPFVVLLGTPTSAVIASDHKGIGTMFYNETSIPVFPINTTGIDSYEIGIEKALLALGKQFVEPVEKKSGGVNIIGCTPLDFWGHNQVAQLKEALMSEGLGINSCWTMEDGLEAIRQTLAGDVNLVTSIAGIKVAKYLKKKFQMPYIVDVAVGEEGTKNLAENLKTLLAGEDNLTLEPNYCFSQGKACDALIVGEQVWANAYRRHLMVTEGLENICVASFFKMSPAFMAEGDYKIESENGFKDCLTFKKPKK